MNKTEEGLIAGPALGAVGAVVGGFIFNLFRSAAGTGFNIYSSIFAVSGAIVVPLVYRLIVRRA